jgi:hypothetical protein
MPLRAGKENVSGNISEMMHAYERKGSIGNTKPRSKGHARLIAVAAAMQKLREEGKS